MDVPHVSQLYSKLINAFFVLVVFCLVLWGFFGYQQFNFYYFFSKGAETSGLKKFLSFPDYEKTLEKGIKILLLYLGCSSFEFECLHDGICVPPAALCDGINDCGDNSDEFPFNCRMPGIKLYHVYKP